MTTKNETFSKAQHVQNIKKIPANDDDLYEIVKWDESESEQKPCCQEPGLRRKVKIGEKYVVKDVYMPAMMPGYDIKKLNGHHRRGLHEAVLKAEEMMSENGDIGKVKVRYRPVEVYAYFVQNDYLENEEIKAVRRRQSGWLVPGPAGMVFFVPEDKFNKFFEMLEDEPKQF